MLDKINCSYLLLPNFVPEDLDLDLHSASEEENNDADVERFINEEADDTDDSKDESKDDDADELVHRSGVAPVQPTVTTNNAHVSAGT